MGRMRLMLDSRTLVWIIAAVIGALALLAGLRVFFEASAPRAPATTSALKPSAFHARENMAVSPAAAQPERKPAQTQEPKQKREIEKKQVAEKIHEVEKKSLPVVVAKVEKSPISNLADACVSLEYPGESPATVEVQAKTWGKVMGLFHDAKKDLQSWLITHRSSLPTATVELMARQIKEARLVRPPSWDEPELSWRGIGVWELYPVEKELVPTVTLGAGFLQLAEKNPPRARFELVRLLAQGWAPCELKRLSGQDIWRPLLSCLQMGESDKTCGDGSYSEGGWAVSSTVAASASLAGCTLPAFKEITMAACLKEMPWTSAERKPAAIASPVVQPVAPAAPKAPVVPSPSPSPSPDHEDEDSEETHG